MDKDYSTPNGMKLVPQQMGQRVFHNKWDEDYSTSNGMKIIPHLMG